MSTLEQAAQEGAPKEGDLFSVKEGADVGAVYRVEKHTPGTTRVTIQHIGGPTGFAPLGDPRVIRLTTLYNGYEAIQPKEATVATATEKKEAAAPREKRKIVRGSTWARRSDGAEVTVVKVEATGEINPDTGGELGRIKLKTKGTERETDSDLQYFRRRFQHVRDPRKS